jgi:uncharacterized membrane protein
MMSWRSEAKDIGSIGAVVRSVRWLPFMIPWRTLEVRTVNSGWRRDHRSLRCGIRPVRFRRPPLRHRMHHGTMSRTASARIKFLIAILAGSGVLHFARPKPYLAIVPKMLRHKRELVYLSGLVELIGAAMMATQRTRRQGGALSAALLVAVFPANVSMALGSAGRPRWYRAAAWVRLPLQLPLLKWAWQAGNEV